MLYPDYIHTQTTILQVTIPPTSRDEALFYLNFNEQPVDHSTSSARLRPARNCE
jgi:hypothetical protein